MGLRAGRRLLIAAVSAPLLLVGAVLDGSFFPAQAATANVLRVGTWKGIPGKYKTIQAAVDAAKPGDWILVAPGDYHESPGAEQGVLITTPGVHLRGMDRNTVIVDGTRPRLGAPACSSLASDQDLGPLDNGEPVGRNGIVVYKASGVYVENLTACNFLTTGGENGNEIWWNGGDGSGVIGMHTYWGNYLTASSTYSNGTDFPRGEYGIFASNADGPGSFNYDYASNMGDAAFYVGACPDCNSVLNHVHAQFSALGYSGTNSGGHMVIQYSEFDNNKSGIVSNSQNNDDAPGPQIGLCPRSTTSICTVFRYNSLHDNNNPNVPGAGSGLAGSSPVGSGIVLAGTEYIELLGNRIVHNGSWGVLVADLPDQEEPPPISNCEGGIYVVPGELCYYQAFGNEVASNAFSGNGFFGNPTNGDIGLATQPHDPGNCFYGNTGSDGTAGSLTTDPPNLQSPPYNPCGQPNGGDMGLLAAEALCATELLAPCPNLPEASYPRPDQSFTLPAIPVLAGLPNPCAGVPSNPWCPGNR